MEGQSGRMTGSVSGVPPDRDRLNRTVPELIKQLGRVDRPPSSHRGCSMVTGRPTSQGRAVGSAARTMAQGQNRPW